MVAVQIKTTGFTATQFGFTKTECFSCRNFGMFIALVEIAPTSSIKAATGFGTAGLATVAAMVAADSAEAVVGFAVATARVENLKLGWDAFGRKIATGFAAVAMAEIVERSTAWSGSGQAIVTSDTAATSTELAIAATAIALGTF